jgi:hypothetical protein
MPTVQIEYYGVSGQGRTATEAKRDAGRRIEAALAGSYTPELVCYRGWAILVYREPHSGWCQRVIARPDDGLTAGRVWGGNACSDRAEALRRARVQLAQLGWQETDGIAPPELLQDNRDRAEFVSWATFQMRHRQVRDQGLSERDAWDYASRNPARPELWHA